MAKKTIVFSQASTERGGVILVHQDCGGSLGQELRTNSLGQLYIAFICLKCNTEITNDKNPQINIPIKIV